jgi:hypothetical protein
MMQFGVGVGMLSLELSNDGPKLGRGFHQCTGSPPLFQPTFEYESE